MEEEEEEEEGQWAWPQIRDSGKKGASSSLPWSQLCHICWQKQFCKNHIGITKNKVPWGFY